jgi:hypothetical protein
MEGSWGCRLATGRARQRHGRRRGYLAGVSESGATDHDFSWGKHRANEGTMTSSPRASKPSGDEAKMASSSTEWTVLPYARSVTMSTRQIGRKRGRMVPGGSLPLRDARRLAQDGGASNSRCRGGGRAPFNSEIRTWRRQRLGLANDA